MQIFSTFEHTSYLELALTALHEKGIEKDKILTVPLNNRVEKRKLLDTLHRSDGVSLIDKGTALAVAFSVIGTSIGFVLDWGPIYWGLIAGTVGFLLGVGVDLFIFKVIHKRKRVIRGKTSEVILIVECSRELTEEVEEILWDHLALGVAKIDD